MEEKKPEEILTDTVDSGVIENVQIAPVGEYLGSDAEGNPVPEKLTAEALTKLADRLNETEREVLADVDHGAAKRGVEKDTKAAGWFTRFVVDPLRGLFATLKLTRHGRELLENREYRYISPTFSLNEDGTPAELHTASLTNMPAFAGFIDPVLNTEAAKAPDNEEKIKMELTKDELVTLIKETVVAMNSCPAEEKKEETVANACSEVKNEEPEKKEEPEAEKPAEEPQPEEKPEEKPAEEAKEEPQPEEKPAEEEKKEEPKKEEVVKLEALNSAPALGADISGKSCWQNLHGEAFWKYLREHPEIKG